MENIEFTVQELAAIRTIVDYAAKYIGEDTIGTIMYTGAFNHLKSVDDGVFAAVVELARKIDNQVN